MVFRSMALEVDALVLIQITLSAADESGKPLNGIWFWCFELWKAGLMNRFLKLFLSEPPLRLVTRSLLRNSLGARYAFEWAALFDSLPYPSYAAGLQIASRYAVLAGAKAFTTIEFGVAGGNGLTALSRYAREVSRQTNLRIHVVGFDFGGGLPPTNDVRDAPWWWTQGDYPCNREELRKRLPEQTELIVGDIRETFPRWLADSDAPPMGFLSIDVDQYTGAAAICGTLGKVEVGRVLPFVSCYFDDIHLFSVPRWAGEFCAIREFNETHPSRQFDRDDWLSNNRPYADRLWLRRMYTLSSQDHPLFSTRVKREPAHLNLGEHPRGGLADVLPWNSLG